MSASTCAWPLRTRCRLRWMERSVLEIVTATAARCAERLVFSRGIPLVRLDEWFTISPSATGSRISSQGQTFQSCSTSTSPCLPSLPVVFAAPMVGAGR